MARGSKFSRGIFQFKTNGQCYCVVRGILPFKKPWIFVNVVDAPVLGWRSRPLDPLPCPDAE